MCILYLGNKILLADIDLEKLSYFTIFFSYSVGRGKVEIAPSKTVSVYRGRGFFPAIYVYETLSVHNHIIISIITGGYSTWFIFVSVSMHPLSVSIHLDFFFFFFIDFFFFFFIIMLTSLSMLYD